MLSRLLAAAALLTIVLAAAPAADLMPALKGIENRYNHIQSLEVKFSETATFQKRKIGPETGTLYLLKPGRMRWQYTSPAGKLWISDGTTVYDYRPDEKRVNESKLSDTEDLQAPMAFLLGKLNLQEQFGRFESEQRGDDLVVKAFPKSDKSPFLEVDFVAAPDYTIKELTINRQDGYVVHFVFSGEKKNPVQPSMFRFTPPPGVEVVK